MDLALTPRKKKSAKDGKPIAAAPLPSASSYAADEINAYIAVRNGLLEEAEQIPTEASLKRLVLANNFVANSLKPTRAPYMTQYLPEFDTVRELKQCHAIEARIVKLRAAVVQAA